MRTTNRILSMLGSVVLLLQAGQVSAVTIAVDVDPLAAGLQSSLIITEGDSVGVDIFISGIPGVEGTGFSQIKGLIGHSWAVGFDSSLLIANTVGSPTPGYFSPDASIYQPAPVIGLSEVSFAEVVIGLNPHDSDGILAQLTFTTSGVGTASLDLRDVVLTTLVAEFTAGHLIDLDEVSVYNILDAEFIIEAASDPTDPTDPTDPNDPPTGIPEPSSLLLLLAGLPAWRLTRSKLQN